MSLCNILESRTMQVHCAGAWLRAHTPRLKDAKMIKHSELTSLIQNSPGRPHHPADRRVEDGQKTEMTEQYRRMLMERMHEDNVCYTGNYLFFGGERSI
jgi:hypothetical protein